MKAFKYNDELYIRAIPSKHLFRSTMVHEVINRGDVFALRELDQILTIVPGSAAVEHCEYPNGKQHVGFMHSALVRQQYILDLLDWIVRSGLQVPPLMIMKLGQDANMKDVKNG